MTRTTRIGGLLLGAALTATLAAGCSHSVGPGSVVSKAGAMTTVKPNTLRPNSGPMRGFRQIQAFRQQHQAKP